MMRELLDVVWNYYVKLAVRILNLPNFKDLHIVTDYVIGHLEGRDIYDINLGVLDSEDSADLRVLSLQEFLHTHPLQLCN